MPRHIIVTAYDVRRERMFETEAEKIRAILKENLVDIHHIGSTSVPGLCAKPIIDIMPIVLSLEQVDSVSAEFENIGYEYMGEFGMEGRRYLRKGGDERTHHVHIFREDDLKNNTRHIAVREYLRAHKADADAYGKLKTELARKFPYDNDGYCDGKEAFVRALEEKAMREYIFCNKM